MPLSHVCLNMFANWDLNDMHRYWNFVGLEFLSCLPPLRLPRYWRLMQHNMKFASCCRYWRFNGRKNDPRRDSAVQITWFIDAAPWSFAAATEAEEVVRRVGIQQPFRFSSAIKQSVHTALADSNASPFFFNLTALLAFAIPIASSQGNVAARNRTGHRASTVETRRWISLTRDVEVARLLQQQIQIGEVVRQQQAGIPHEVQYVPKHAAVPVDEVVLLQGVQDDGDAAVEQFR